MGEGRGFLSYPPLEDSLKLKIIIKSIWAPVAIRISPIMEEPTIAHEEQEGTNCTPTHLRVEPEHSVVVSMIPVLHLTRKWPNSKYFSTPSVLGPIDWLLCLSKDTEYLA